MKDGAMYIASVRSQNDNFKIAWACVNRNPKRIIIGIVGGINSLGLKAKKIERSQNIHDQTANVVTMLCTLSAKLRTSSEKRTSSENQAASFYWLHMNSKK